jgi:hypothetical protein
MFFNRAREEVYDDLSKIDPVETGIRAKETVPKTPAAGDVYVDPMMSSERGESVPAFLISVNIVLILASDWDTAFKQAEDWAPVVADAVYSSLEITRISLISLPVENQTNGRPVLLLSGVRE